MITNIKSFLDSLDEEEKIKEKKLFKKNKARGFGTKMPKSFFNYPIYQPINEIILSENPFHIIPRRWGELDRNFENILIRNCLISNQDIVKVSNLYNYKNSINKYSYIAIPLSSTLYNNLYKKYKFQIDIYIFIQIARMVIQGNGYDVSKDFHSCSLKKVLNLLLSNLLEYSYINYNKLLTECSKLSVDIFELLMEIHHFYKDDRLSKKTIMVKYLLEKCHVNK